MTLKVILENTKNTFLFGHNTLSYIGCERQPASASTGRERGGSQTF
jgi:hypothetical protein